MGISESVRTFIQTCPAIFALNTIVGFEYLGENPTSFVIESTPSDPIVKTYTDGSTVRRYSFLFAGKEYWGDDAILNLENIGFYESFSAWLEEQTNEKNLPDLGSGKEALSIKATDLPFLLSVEEEKARYQIACELIYFQK